MTYRLLFILSISFALLSCQDDDNSQSPLDMGGKPTDVVGLDYVVAEDGDFQVIYDSLTALLTANASISIVAEVDHRANAATTGETLDQTRVVFFGNPQLGTPLMQSNPQAGLDLPQRMLVYQDGEDDVIVAYTTPQYIASRHGVGNAATIPTIRTALNNLAGNAGGGTVQATTNNDVGRNAGVMQLTANGDIDSVYARLRQLISDNPDLGIIAELDHQANAASVNLELVPTKLIIFGNPALGTPLLKMKQSIGIDLPQKMLLYESSPGRTTICYNNPEFLATRHGISTTVAQLTTISEALATLAQAALRR